MLLWSIPAYVAIFIGMHVLPNAWVALLGFHLALIVALLPRLRTLPARIFAPVSPILLLLMVFAGSLGGLGLWMVWPYTGVSTHYHSQLTALGMMTGDFSWPLFIVYFSLVNPLIEESFWRDALASFNRGPALVDFLFGGYHLIILVLFVNPFWLVLAFAVITATGWLWRTITRITDSLLPAIIFHIFADFSIVWVVYQKSL